MARQRDFIKGTTLDGPDVYAELVKNANQLPLESVDGDFPLWVIVDKGALQSGNLDVIEELSADTSQEDVDARVAHWQGVSDAQDADALATSIAAEIPELTYVDKRTGNYSAHQPSYKSIQEQLDMLYKDTVNGTTTWQDHITDVKEAHPKPSE